MLTSSPVRPTRKLAISLILASAALFAAMTSVQTKAYAQGGGQVTCPPGFVLLGGICVKQAAGGGN